MASNRKQTIQNASWLYDIRERKQLNLNPPYQRWSVWNRQFQESFIDTILLGYPSPAIFLYRQVEETGKTKYDVVDGKQRLMAVFEFVEGDWPVGDKCPLQNLRGKYFADLTEAEKLAIWDYDFAVELLPTNNAAVIDDIFERLNKNTARLTRQELRHAKYGGDFIQAAEDLAIWTWGVVVGGTDIAESDAISHTPRLPPDLPRIGIQARRQMKDIEVVATLLLFLEEGVKGYSADDLDRAVSSREAWSKKTVIEDEYRRVIDQIALMCEEADGHAITQSRIRNQTDFYSFFGAVAELMRAKKLPPLPEVLPRVSRFLEQVDAYEAGGKFPEKVGEYYEAARSASNDVGPRQTRIRIMRSILTGR